MNENLILLRRGKILIPDFEPDTEENGRQLAASFNLNLQDLGYTLSPDALSIVARLPPDESAKLLRKVVKSLLDLVGDCEYSPMYPNFPAQVIEASTAELYFNAYLHYFTAWVADLTGGRAPILLPRYTKKARGVREETDRIPLTVLTPATYEDLAEIVRRIVGANTSISPADRADLEWLVTHGYVRWPYTIPNKENLAIFTAFMLARPNNDEFGGSPLAKLFKTATDVLRLACAMSDGDVSLAEPTKFRAFSRKERRRFMDLLDRIPNLSCLEDMHRRKGIWLVFGKHIHAGEFKKRYPEAWQAFYFLRQGGKVETFNSKVEAYLRHDDIPAAVWTLIDRPGEFARRLDQLLRQSSPAKRKFVTQRFSEVAEKVSTPVLLQVASHFERNDFPNRLVFPKGSVAKVQVIPKPAARVGSGRDADIIAICQVALKNRFNQLSSLGKIYIDPQLKDYLLPFSQRSASKGKRNLVRGSKVQFGGGGTLRFFIYWKQNEGDRTDLDLSAVMYSSDWEFVGNVSYFNLRHGGGKGDFSAVHSGDITDAPNGACEFIDIDISKMNARYVVMSVNSFTLQKFNTLPECAAGWMVRSNPNSGEVFDPATVVDKIAITSPTQIVVPLIIDLVDRKVIWVDAAIKPNADSWWNNVRSNSDSISLVGQAFTRIQKPNLYNLLMLHTGRGTLVTFEKEADTVFSVAAGTQYDLERIASEFMANPKEDVHSVAGRLIAGQKSI